MNEDLLVLLIVHLVLLTILCMLHYKVATPPWLSGKKEKVDIDWEDYKGLNKLRLFWMKVKLRLQIG